MNRTAWYRYLAMAGALAAFFFLQAGRADAQVIGASGYNPYTGTVVESVQGYNPYVGEVGQGAAYVNPFTTAYGRVGVGYNPYTGTYSRTVARYNPYLGQTIIRERAYN